MGTATATGTGANSMASPVSLMPPITVSIVEAVLRSHVGLALTWSSSVVDGLPLHLTRWGPTGVRPLTPTPMAFLYSKCAEVHHQPQLSVPQAPDQTLSQDQLCQSCPRRKADRRL